MMRKLKLSDSLLKIQHSFGEKSD